MRAAAPLLLMHGTSAQTVGFINGLPFCSALRNDGTQEGRLAYPNEGHHLAGLTKGVRYLKKESSRGSARH